MAREQSYGQNRFKTCSFHEKQRCWLVRTRQLQKSGPWKISCRIWCESIKYSCQNVHLTLKSRILVFPWPGDFSKAEWSLRAKESAHLVLCFCETRICCFCETRICCFYETKILCFCIYIIYI